ncbi:hypothetical protein ACFT79_11985 [[Kitasatospora] papulosa]|uniref:hypothetical protein n=1 Tax=[Kitasatospora] papulosa TaxID=1464011 RepID=UPI00362CE08A
MNQENNTGCAIKGCSELATNELSLDGKASTAVLELCQPHTYMFTANQKVRVGKFAQRLEAEGIFERGGHTKGWVYVIRMSNGHMKIGFTSKEDLGRLEDLSRQQGGPSVQVLAVTPGGESLEALKHAEWSHLRVPGRMEQFYADPSLLAWAQEMGIHPSARDAMEQLTDRQARKHNDSRRNNAAKWAEVLNVSTVLTGELSKDPRHDWSAEVINDDNDWNF